MRTFPHVRGGWPVAWLTLVGCAGSGSDPADDAAPTDQADTDTDTDADSDTDTDADTDADSDSDTDVDTGAPTGDTGGPGAEPLVAPPWVAGLPNIDAPNDWTAASPTDDELAPLVITPGQAPADELRLSLVSGAPVRVWHDGAILLDATTPDATLPWSADPIELSVEFASFKIEDTLVVEERVGGAARSITETVLRSGEMFLNHHLLESERVVMVDMGAGNRAMRDVFARELGAMFEPTPGRTWRGDVWIQDEIEFASTTTATGRMDMVIDSIRDRGLDGYPEATFRGENFAVHTWGNQRANTLDSFGNMEATPPIAGFPAGRIYYGGEGSYIPQDTTLRDFLEAQQVQDPLMIDSTWLCVGHVDEFTSFVPDPTAPRGFRFVYTDTRIAWQILEAMPPDTRLPKWEGRQSHGFATVGEIVGDAARRNLNDDVQADHLDPILAQLTAEWGLTPDEILMMPGIFEEPFGCGRSVAALIPGMANMTVVNVPGGPTKVFLADPFLRADLTDQATDPMIAHVRSIFPSTLEMFFVDDWDTYHMALGEVHCGTNVVRTPGYDWWVDTLNGGVP